MHDPTTHRPAERARVLAARLRRPQVVLGLLIWSGLVALLLMLSVGS